MRYEFVNQAVGSEAAEAQQKSDEKKMALLE